MPRRNILFLRFRFSSSLYPSLPPSGSHIRFYFREAVSNRRHATVVLFFFGLRSLVTGCVCSVFYLSVDCISRLLVRTTEAIGFGRRHPRKEVWQRTSTRKRGEHRGPRESEKESLKNVCQLSWTDSTDCVRNRGKSREIVR